MDTTFLNFFFLLLLIPLLYFLRQRISHSQSSATLPPSPTALPLVGHLHLLSDQPHHTLAQLAHKFGPILYLQLGQVPTIVVSSSELVREVFTTKDNICCNRPQLISAKCLSFGCSDVTFSSYGPYWRQARRICVTELLSQKQVALFQGVRREEVTRLVSSISDVVNTPVDMSRLLLSLANDILCRVAFGTRFSSLAGGGLARVLTETQALFAGFCVADFYPGWDWISWVSGYRRRLEKNRDDLKAVYEQIVGERETNMEHNHMFDFLGVLLQVQKRNNLEVPITEDNLKALVLDMFVAGTDTTAATLEWVLAELMKHPKAMKKVQEEVRKNKEASSHNNNSFLKAVIKETLRLHPPAPLLVPRETVERCSLGGYEIPAKTRLLINAHAIGRDERTWKSPLEFNPERFVGVEGSEEDEDGGRGSHEILMGFIPFGGGRRGCPGSSFATATVEAVLEQLLYHFDWNLPSGGLKEDVDMSEVFGLASRKKTPLLLVPIPFICPPH